MKITSNNRRLAQEIIAKIGRRERDVEKLEAMKREGQGEMVIITDKDTSYEKRVALFCIHNASVINTIIGALKEEAEQLYEELNSLQ